MQMSRAKIQAKGIKIADFSFRREVTVLIVVQQKSIRSQVLVLPTFETQECSMHIASNAD